MADRASRAYRKLLEGKTTGSKTYGTELKKQVRKQRNNSSGRYAGRSRAGRSSA